MSDASKVIETFDRWAAEGDGDRLEEAHGDVVRQVVERMGIGAGERILDLGCGNGWATRLIAQASPGVQAIGVDASPGMIARADELHSLTIRARYDLGSFEKLDFKDGHFDRVFSMEALYYASDLDAALREAQRVLKPGGSADVVVDFYAGRPGVQHWPEAMGLELTRLDEAGWKAAFEGAGFAGVTCERVVDRRGAGEPGGNGEKEECRKDPCSPADMDERRAMIEAGSLWIHAEKPA